MKPNIGGWAERQLLVLMLLAVSPSGALANPEQVREDAREQLGLSLPSELRCSNNSLDPNAPIKLPLLCKAKDYNGWVKVTVDHTATLDLAAAAILVRHGVDWISASDLDVLPPVRWGFDPVWFFHPEISGRELLCARGEVQVEVQDISARCFVAFGRSEDDVSLLSLEFSGFDVEIDFPVFAPLRPMDRAVVEARIEAIAFGVQLVRK